MSLPRRILASLAVALVVAVVLLESVPRFVEIPGLRLEDLDPEAVQVERANVRPHPYLAYYPTPSFRTPSGAKNQASHNALGFRGPETTWEKPPGTYRIACLGGSSTYGHGPTSNETNWTARLEAHLNETRAERGGTTTHIEVINAGCRGYSTFELLGNLAFRVLDLEPDLVIVYETINDMRCALYHEPVPDNTHWRAVWPVRRSTLLDRSYTFLFLRSRLTDYVESRKDLGFYVMANYAGGKTDPYSWPPEKDLGFRNFTRNLENIVALARANGAEIVLATQAIRREDVLAAYPVSGADQLRAFDHMSEMLGTVARDEGVLFIDAQTPMREELARRRAAGAGLQEDGLFTNDVHMTDEGCDLLARTFADALLESGALDRPPPGR